MEKKVTSISLPEAMVRRVDVRARELGLARATYVITLLERELRE